MSTLSNFRVSPEGRGIAVIDRGGDDRKLYDDFIEKKRRFVIRQMVNRDIVLHYNYQVISMKANIVPIRLFLTLIF